VVVERSGRDVGASAVASAELEVIVSSGKRGVSLRGCRKGTRADGSHAAFHFEQLTSPSPRHLPRPTSAWRLYLPLPPAHQLQRVFPPTQLPATPLSTYLRLVWWKQRGALWRSQQASGGRYQRCSTQSECALARTEVQGANATVRQSLIPSWVWTHGTASSASLHTSAR
jgi:hypothetical protein